MASPLSSASASIRIMFSQKLTKTIRLHNVISTHIQRTLSSTAVSDVKMIRRGDHSIACKVIMGGNPGIIFCPGFQSNMMGVKATALEKYATEHNLAYVRFESY